MKRVIILLSVLSAAATTTNAQPTQQKPTNSADSVSYFLGLYFGQQIIDAIDYYDGFLVGQFRKDSFWNGLYDRINNSSDLTQEDISEYLTDWFETVLPQLKEQQGAEKRTRGAEWLTQIERETGVHKTASGLLYRIKNQGNNRHAADNDGVRISYTGTRIDGEEFDSNDDITFDNLDNLIAGFVEGIKLIGEGGRITIWIPEDLGYGGDGPDPWMPLKFEINLKKVLINGIYPRTNIHRQKEELYGK